MRTTPPIKPRRGVTIRGLMRGSPRQLLVALALVLAVAAAARAADTGTSRAPCSIRTVQPVADATVKIAGDRLPGRPHRPDRRATASTSSSTCCPASTRSRSTRPGSAWPGARRDRRSRQGHAGRRSCIGLAVNEALTVTRGDADRRRAIDRSQLQLQRRHAQQPAARAHLSRAVPADSRRRRQPQPGRPGRRRQPAGQHLSDRRRQHHQSRVRLSRAPRSTSSTSPKSI